MDKWIYKVVSFETKQSFLGGTVDVELMEAELNKYGNSGWEVINSTAITQSNGSTRTIIYNMKKKFL